MSANCQLQSVGINVPYNQSTGTAPLFQSFLHVAPSAGIELTQTTGTVTLTIETCQGTITRTVTAGETANLDVPCVRSISVTGAGPYAGTLNANLEFCLCCPGPLAQQFINVW